ncbi:hypothetical protein [Streptomyces sp. GC420]|nr:hypothetical protein [Streptomyces sp. GC420]NBM18800.1 hypothetical protein [Streptomyces sp. GC420]
MFGSRHDVVVDHDGHGWFKWRCSCGALGSGRSHGDAWSQSQKHIKRAR